MLTLDEILDDFVQLSECKSKNVTEHSQDSLGKTPLHWMAYLGDVEAIKLLMSRDSRVNIPDHDGNAPLHIAVLSRQTPAIQFLIESGADSKLENDLGETPKSLAFSVGYQPVIEVFDHLEANNERSA